MNDKALEVIATLERDFAEFRGVLKNESDRGCALFSAAYLDKAISDLLYVSFVSNKKIDEELFSGNAPLHTFSSRIKLAFYLGLISRVCRRDLDIIRDIRNDFAHKLQYHSFEDGPIRDRCNALSFSFHDKGARPRAHFTAAVTGVLSKIQGAAFLTVPHAELPDDVPSAEFKARYSPLVAEMTGDAADKPKAEG